MAKDIKIVGKVQLIGGLLAMGAIVMGYWTPAISILGIVSVVTGYYNITGHR